MCVLGQDSHFKHSEQDQIVCLEPKRLNVLQNVLMSELGKTNHGIQMLLKSGGCKIKFQCPEIKLSSSAAALDDLTNYTTLPFGRSLSIAHVSSLSQHPPFLYLSIVKMMLMMIAIMKIMKMLKIILFRSNSTGMHVCSSTMLHCLSDPFHE